VTFCRE